MSTSNRPSNRLISSTSPYLLQHAHNPVNWFPWGEEALQKASKENKLILVSIGYSACHWCHVMEHESFEDDEVAEVMNKHFVCIKVDREERPDIDQVYMNAVQIMTGQGGWPLNCITLPDGRPVYGGTYFPKAKWINLLKNVFENFQSEPKKFFDYAEKLKQGIEINESTLVKNVKDSIVSKEFFKEVIERWKRNLDQREGGANRAPKFPIPSNYLFLLRYAILEKDEVLLRHVELTLDKMALGGIYDQIGGGFARYSTDVQWKVPHFEKMLYDNAQLIFLYSEAYQVFKKPLYQSTVIETITFVEKEWKGGEGNYFSALDADTDGVEGKFYVWKKEELEKILGNEFSHFAKYYSVDEFGYWEHDNYVLIRKHSDEAFCLKENIGQKELQTIVSKWKNLLFSEREKRSKPSIDDKSLISWNAMLVEAYAKAYAVFNDYRYLESAKSCTDFIFERAKNLDGGLYHNYKNKKANIDGFLEDYSFVISACLQLYQVTFVEDWLFKAKEFCDYSLEYFYEPEKSMFYFTSSKGEQLFTRSIEIHDNVIPSSNSTMANNLFLLGTIFDQGNYISIAEKMFKAIHSQIMNYPSAYSNWLQLGLYFTYPFYQVAIVGSDCKKNRTEIYKHYYPLLLLQGSPKDTSLPLLKNKYVDGKTNLYVCRGKSCLLPTEKVEEAAQLLK